MVQTQSTAGDNVKTNLTHESSRQRIDGASVVEALLHWDVSLDQLWFASPTVTLNPFTELELTFLSVHKCILLFLIIIILSITIFLSVSAL